MAKVGLVFDRMTQVERYLCCYILMILVLITFVQVVMRSVFSAPFSWSEELTLMFLVWFGYLCIPLDIYTDSHSALYFLYNKLPGMARKIIDLGRHGILVWFSVLMVKYGWKITKLNMPKKQPATGFPQGWLFAPLVVGGILMVLYAGYNFVATLLRPLSAYNAVQGEKSADDLNKERGGSV